ncbi:MAG: DnaA/Hda family protein [Emcibacteraceae bacterium]
MAEQGKNIPEQLLLNWPVNEKFAQGNFLASYSNEKAVNWIDCWPDWQRGGEHFHCLIIYGPKGCGKTHLCHVWREISNAQILNADDVDKIDFLSSDNLVYVLEDIDQIIDNIDTQHSLLHLYNWVREQGGYLLLTANARPKNWPVSLKDLSSRLLATETVEIKAPDDELLKAIINKQFSDRQIVIRTDVINYLVARTERSFEAVRQLVQKIDDLSRMEKKKITVATARKAMENWDEV